MKPSQVVGDLARPKVIALAKIEHLAGHLGRRGVRASVRRPRPVPEAGFTVRVKPLFPSGLGWRPHGVVSASLSVNYAGPCGRHDALRRRRDSLTAAIAFDVT